MERLIQQLLDLASVRKAKGYPVKRSELDVCQLITEVIEDTQRAHPRHRLEVECLGDGLGAYDATALTQLVTNLTQNAIRYGDPERPIRIEVDARGDEVLIRVVNHGEPIDPDLLTRLFRPFERGRTRNKQGAPWPSATLSGPRARVWSPPSPTSWRPRIGRPRWSESAPRAPGCRARG